MKRLFHFNLKLILSILVTVIPCSRLFSNKIAVSIAPGGVDQANKTITFDLSWQNSWRVDGTPYTSSNWDAAWVFLKFRDCSASANTQFTHGLVSTTLGDHSFNVNSSSTPFEPTLADGSTVGIDQAPNNTGVMLRSANFPITTPSTISARVTLKVTNMPTSSSAQGLDVRIYGIEMVFIPQGTYYLGDGNTSNKSYLSFATSTSSNQAIPVSSEGAQSIYEVAGGGICPSQTCALTGSFPKGFNPFYIMKYEITEGQYVDFLNASPAIVQSMHFTSNVSGNRYAITQNTTTLALTAGKPYRACNFLSWADVGTYLDWAALRPLTELEYEKACKGTAPVSPYDYAMGVAFATRAVDIAGPENGTETISVPGNSNICAAGSIPFGGSGDGGQGPLRGGIFATGSTASRNQTGASFYGVMELSGNVDEYYVSSLAGTATDNGLVQGDGILDDGTGQFNNIGWPSALFPVNMIIHRGGNWSTGTVVGGSIVGDATASSLLNVSNRGGGALTTRIYTSGGRGGRSYSVTPTLPSVTSPQTFNHTGAQQTFTVPDGVTSVTIEAYGAQGGNSGGLGGRAKANFAVAPGYILYVYVGGQGAQPSGGFNGGGNGGGFTGSWGGGGASDVRFGGNAIANRIIIGGGGGGKGGSGYVPGAGGSVASSFNTPNYCAAGAGGGAASSSGASGSSSGAGGNGGTSPGGGGGGGYTGGGLAGGSGGTTPPSAGGSGQGGNGGIHSSCSPNAGGGGGGGYYGGGGGGVGACGTYASAGGGSSAALGTVLTPTNVSFTGGVKSGNGQVIISWY